MTVYAGLYSELLTINRTPTPGVSVTVYESGTSTLATLYTSRLKTSTAANPVTVDDQANLVFYAEPGSYDLSLNGRTIPVVVGNDPGETFGAVVAESIAPDVAFSSRYAPIGPQIDYRNFDITPDDAGFDSGPGINALLTAARAVGGTAVLGPGTYYADETLVFNSIADQGAVGLTGVSALGSLLGNKPVTIRRPVGSTHTMATALGRGVQLENITFDGQDTTGLGLVVNRGFEFSASRVRFVDIRDTAMDLRALSNSRLDRVFIDRCGTPGSGTDKPALHVRGNSSYEYSTNTLWMSDVHIERSFGTAFNLAHGSNVDDLAEFIRCYGLHIEQNINNTSMVAYTTDPVLKIGNVRGAWFYGTFIYGGTGPLVYYEKQVDSGASAMRGVHFFGGRLFGNVASHAIDAGTPDRLVDLVTGAQFSMQGMEFDTALTEMVRIGSGFGQEAYFNECSWLTRAGATTTRITDSRPDTTVARYPMDIAGFNAKTDSAFSSVAASRVVSVETAAGQTAAFRLSTATSSRWDIRKGTVAESGSNVGSDFEIAARTDAGGTLSTPFTITRSTGLTTLGAGLTVTGTTTLTGDVTIPAASGARIVAIQRAAGQVGRIALRTGTSDRWHVNINATAEGGSNAGSDLEIVGRSDAGANIGTALTITRSTLAAAFNGDVAIAEAKNLIFGTTTGTKIASLSTQKLAFWGQTPIIRPASTPAAATDLATALTLVNDLRTKLLAIGLIA